MTKIGGSGQRGGGGDGRALYLRAGGAGRVSLFDGGEGGGGESSGRSAQRLRTRRRLGYLFV